ncbi:RICIN domain-containing protein [Streptomyces sp. DSM 44915]|uniref:RICIN domain-containing protein n=1 Tax=Streptomyces chisholmiae TaxID=3075540 RepID=A0ABU2JRY3_9ACTN|nr:RICIN domain-containing protein [Streptomyces sp. DSM 44915]MDT0267478.1 RICIN domain-containing protein [Streptomyces sp. DSM 44915]
MTNGSPRSVRLLLVAAMAAALFPGFSTAQGASASGPAQADTRQVAGAEIITSAGACLTVQDGSDDAFILAEPCTGQDPQRFRLRPVEVGWYEIVTFVDKCAIVYHNLLGGTLRQERCGVYADFERFSVVPVGDGWYEIVAADNECLTTVPADDLTFIETRPCTGDQTQRFRFRSVSA